MCMKLQETSEMREWMQTIYKTSQWSKDTALIGATEII